MNYNPYLSIIIISRNDDYQGGGFLRMQMAISNLLFQANQYNLKLELIIIDWNPPQGKPLLKDALVMPSDLGHSIVRFIVVPNSIHKTYNCSPKMNMVGVAAMNVGIRRATGEFIWPTNSDLLFSPELMQFLASEKLRKDCFYRAFRYDVNRDVLNINSPKEQLDFCQNNVIQSFLETKKSIHGLTGHPTLQTDCGADLVIFSKEYWYKLHGYPQINNLGFSADVLLCYMAYLSGLKETVLPTSMKVYHIDHDSRWRKLSDDRMYRFFKDKIFNKLSDNNQVAWRGFFRSVYLVEKKIYDFCQNIFYSLFGYFLKKYRYPEKKDFDVRYLGWEFHKILLDMLKGKRSYIYNNENWGLPQENFKEFIINDSRN